MTSQETPTWATRANYWSGWRAIGGRLALDESHLTFKPHALERALGGRRNFDAPLNDIESIVVERRGGVPRKRLYVRLRDGTEAAFLVPNADDRAADLRRVTNGGP